MLNFWQAFRQEERSYSINMLHTSHMRGSTGPENIPDIRETLDLGDVIRAFWFKVTISSAHFRKMVCSLAAARNPSGDKNFLWLL